jgi:hypothetical protein
LSGVVWIDPAGGGIGSWDVRVVGSLDEVRALLDGSASLTGGRQDGGHHCVDTRSVKVLHPNDLLSLAAKAALAAFAGSDPTARTNGWSARPAVESAVLLRRWCVGTAIPAAGRRGQASASNARGSPLPVRRYSSIWMPLVQSSSTASARNPSSSTRNRKTRCIRVVNS